MSSEVTRRYWELNDKLTEVAQKHGFSCANDLVSQFKDQPLSVRDETRPILIEQLKILEQMKKAHLKEYDNVIVFPLSRRCLRGRPS